MVLKKIVLPIAAMTLLPASTASSEPVRVAVSAKAAEGDRLKGEVAAAVLAWTTAYNRGDYERTASMFTRDLIRWYADGEDDYAKEQDSVRLFRDADRKGTKIRYTARIKDILLTGDRDAVVMSVWTRDMQRPDGTKESHDTRYITLWRKERDGVWRVARYLGTRVPPPQTSTSN